MRQSIPKVRIKGTKIYAGDFTGALGGSVGAGQAYDASGTGRRAKNWLTSSAGPKSALTFALPTLRRRSRDATRKNPYAESAVETLQTSIVGNGIVPLFKTPSEDLNKQLAELFNDWSDEADADGRCNWTALQSLAARSVVEGGEVFARFRVRRPGDMETVPLQVQLLEPEFVPMNESRAVRGHEIINGIQFNLFGQRTAYWMHRRHPFDASAGTGILDLPTRPIPASEISHIYSARRPGQIRGEPWLVRGLIKLFDLDAYDDAELLRKKSAALIAGFITTPEEEGFGGETAPDADGVSDVTWEPGAMVPLGPGEEIEFSSPTDVGSSYEAFNRQQLRAVAVSAGVLYEQLTGDYSKVNDRTYRASVNEFRRKIGMIQRNLMIFQFCRPVIRLWLSLAVLAELIEVPASFGPRDLFRNKWMVPGWSYIHPVQEIAADMQAIRAGIKSRTQVVGERGEDASLIDAEIASDNERADELGNIYDSDPRQVSLQGLSQAQKAGEALEETEQEPEDQGDEDNFEDTEDDDAPTDQRRERETEDA